MEKQGEAYAGFRLWCRGFWSLWLLVLLLPFSASALETIPPLLLTFNITSEVDLVAFEELSFTEPATFFLTSEFAHRFPHAVQQFAEEGTLGIFLPLYQGSNGTVRISEIIDQARRDIFEITGKDVTWVRIQGKEDIQADLSIARQLGIHYSSSEYERGLRQKVLPELPIGVNSTGKIPFTDRSIFKDYGMDASLAISLLEEDYTSRSGFKNPQVLQLHPPIIGSYDQVLPSLIKVVKEAGGRCLSFEQYLFQSGQVTEAKQAGDADTLLPQKNKEGVHVAKVPVKVAATGTEWLGRGWPLLLLPLIGLVTFFLMRGAKDGSGNRRKKQFSETEKPVVYSKDLSEYIAGFVYKVHSYNQAQSPQAHEEKFAIFLTSGKEAELFWMNTEKDSSVAAENQIKVVAADFAALASTVYVDTSRLVSVDSRTCRLVSLIGLVPGELKNQIRTHVKGNRQIPANKKERILKEFV